MDNIQEELKDLVINFIIPESEEYLEELHELLEKKEATPDDMEVIKDMESFLVELQNIVLAIDQNELDDNQAEDIYQRIKSMMDEHDEE